MYWSMKDEKRHRQLVQEIQELERRRAEARQKVDDLLRECYDTRTDEIDADKVIQLADAFRDALEPFDSGIRVQAALQEAA